MVLRKCLIPFQSLVAPLDFKKEESLNVKRDREVDCMKAVPEKKRTVFGATSLNNHVVH